MKTKNKIHKKIHKLFRKCGKLKIGKMKIWNFQSGAQCITQQLNTDHHILPYLVGNLGQEKLDVKSLADCSMWRVAHTWLYRLVVSVVAFYSVFLFQLNIVVRRTHNVIQQNSSISAVLIQSSYWTCFKLNQFLFCATRDRILAQAWQYTRGYIALD